MNAISWDDLLRALRAGDKGIPSSLDELVLVQDLSKESKRMIPGIKTISYTGNLKELVIKLRGDTKGSVPKEGQTVHPISHIDTTQVLEEPREATLEPTQHGRKVEGTILNSAETELLDNDNEEIANPLSSSIALDKIVAAKTILRVYRNHVELKRKRAALVLLNTFRRRRIVQQTRLSAIDETRRHWKKQLSSITTGFYSGPLQTSFGRTSASRVGLFGQVEHLCF